MLNLLLLFGVIYVTYSAFLLETNVQMNEIKNYWCQKNGIAQNTIFFKPLDQDSRFLRIINQHEQILGMIKFFHFKDQNNLLEGYFIFNEDDKINDYYIIFSQHQNLKHILNQSELKNFLLKQIKDDSQLKVENKYLREKMLLWTHNIFVDLKSLEISLHFLKEIAFIYKDRLEYLNNLETVNEY